MSTHPAEPREPGLPTIDVNEYGGKREGVRQAMNRRLFMQLLVFDAPPGADPSEVAALAAALLVNKRIPGVVYADAMDPRGMGLLSWGEDPARFVREVRPLFTTEALRSVAIRPGWTMIGRTYATGHEPDLEHAMLKRPINNVMNEAYAWHVWYPLRRSGAFAKLEGHEQSQILREHAQ